MTIIGTEEEIKEIKMKCDGRCADGEWCVFADKSNTCPVDTEGLCMAFDINGKPAFSVLNER